MLGRLVHKVDFERLLAVRSRLRSAHFAVHHVAGGPAAPKRLPPRPQDGELSTADVGNLVQPVDNSASHEVSGHWLGCVVPKRHARRAVTRSLVKRQMRSVFEKHARALPAGLWLLRLSAGFPVSAFVSARSTALAEAMRSELDGLMLNLQQRHRLASPTMGAQARQPGSGAC